MDAASVRRNLEARLQKLRSRVDRIGADLRRPGHQDSEERAAERQNDEVLEALDDAERREIEQIRAALRRLDEGVYDVCNGCGEAIDRRRLEILPYTDRCVSCAER